MTDRRQFHAPVTEFKALNDRRGEFTALVSVFGNVDRGGDRVMPGAFGKTLGEWAEKDAPIPIIWSHMWDNPEAHIGEADPGDVVESDDGLLVKRGRIDVDRPFAAQVFHLLERRRVKEFSFGYALRDSAVAKDGALNLLDVDLFEIGPTLKGMNPETELLAVKALAQATDPVDHPKQATTDITFDTPALTALAARLKAGARHSKETIAALTRIRAEVDALIGTGEVAGDEPTKSVEAETSGKASDPDEDITTRIHILEGRMT